MTRESHQLFADGGVPDADAPVVAAGGNPRPVGMEDRREDLQSVTGEGPQKPSGGCVPEAERWILAGRQDGAAVRAKGDRLDAAREAGQLRDQLARGRVDDHDLRVVITRGRQSAAIGAERHDADAREWGVQCRKFGAGYQVPKTDPMFRSRSEPSAVRADDQAIDRVAHRHVFVSEDVDRVAGRGVPDADRPVLAPGRQEGSIGAERQRADRLVMRLQRADQAGANCIPEADLAVPRSGSDPPPIGAKSNGVDVSAVAKDASVLWRRRIPDSRCRQRRRRRSCGHHR